GAKARAGRNHGARLKANRVTDAPRHWRAYREKLDALIEDARARLGFATHAAEPGNLSFEAGNYCASVVLTNATLGVQAAHLGACRFGLGILPLEVRLRAIAFDVGDDVLFVQRLDLLSLRGLQVGDRIRGALVGARLDDFGEKRTVFAAQGFLVGEELAFQRGNLRSDGQDLTLLCLAF